MHQPYRRHPTSRRPYAAARRSLLAGCALSLLSACSSSFFQITPETGANGLPAKPAPATKPAKRPAEKAPPEKAAEKRSPVEKPVPAAPQPAAVAPAPTASPARPPDSAPAVARPEPIVELPVSEPTPAGSDSAGVARLMHAAALWDAVRLFHPWVATTGAAWDNATVRRLTDVRVAGNREQYARVLGEWLSRLDDPVTRMVNNERTPTTGSTSAGSAEVLVQVQVTVTGVKKTRVADSALVLTWPALRGSSDGTAWNAMRTAVHDARGTTPLVIDLRKQGPSRGEAPGDSVVRGLQLDIANTLAWAPATGAGIRRRVYEGWPDQRPGIAAQFGSVAWRVTDAALTIAGNLQPIPRRIVFIADSTTQVPLALMALVSAKQATLVAESRLTDRGLVPVTRIALGDGLVAETRTGELVNADGSTGIQPDTIVPPAAIAGDSAPSLKTALLIARAKLAAPRFSPATATAAALARNEAALMVSTGWNGAHYPVMGARLLAVFKMWGTLRGFHAYGDLRDESLDDAMQRIIPRVEAATDAYGYAAAMLDFASSTNDAQATLVSPTLQQHIGAAAAPFTARWIEGRAIVTQVAADEAGRASGLVVGDEIVAADGYPMPAYLNERRRYGAASNDWTRYRNTMTAMPRGVPGNALFRVRDGQNRERSTTIQRQTEYLDRLPASDRSATPVYRNLGGGVGYIDLDRATGAGADSALNQSATTRALILDARGSGTSTTAPAFQALLATVFQRLATQPLAVRDKQIIRVLSEPCPPTSSLPPGTSCILERRQFDDMIAADSARHYRGRTVVLIDERTQGVMEQFAMGLETAANSVLIGSPSAGAAGALTGVELPGQMTLTFSGSEIRNADGRQLQRVGLTPQIAAPPTVMSVRTGTDEVLARAHQWLLQQLDPVTPRRRQ